MENGNGKHLIVGAEYIFTPPINVWEQDVEGNTTDYKCRTFTTAIYTGTDKKTGELIFSGAPTSVPYEEIVIIGPIEPRKFRTTFDSEQGKHVISLARNGQK